MSSAEGVYFQSSLEIDNTTRLVSLTDLHVYWEGASKGGGSDSPTGEPLFKKENGISLREIIAVRAEKQAMRESRENKGSQMHLCIEMRPIHPYSFTIYCIRRQHKHKWRERKVTFSCRDSHLCQEWVERLKTSLSRKEFNRPKKLLVFVNPYGGKKKAPKLFAEKVAPLFDLAEIYTEVIVTQRANHAYDVIREKSLKKFDGLVCVGGDGMFVELLNGLLDRTHSEACVEQTAHHQIVRPGIRVGVIPAGSTDTVVYSTTGVNDPITSTLQIILGDSIGVDVCSIAYNGQHLKYSVSLLGYGYYGDVIVESERLRWMGPKRYDWCGFKKFLGNKSYEGEVSFLLSTDAGNHPRDKTRCLNNCAVCKAAYERDRSTAKDISPSKVSVGKDGWHKVRGRFLAINSVTMSCRCQLSLEGVSPTSHLGDGCTDLLLVYDCSRFDYMRHLYRCTNKTADQFDFNFVHVYRVKEFSFRSLFDEGAGQDKDRSASTRDGHQQLGSRMPHNSVWNCDGEVLEYPNIDVRVHCQMINLFARGVESDEGDSVHCSSCCVGCD